ncbi:transcriptional regulator with XRE-family HTH domain [Streptomyces sp. LBL]|uniref:helix-turn-helix domain-containing protein n=1 Tax=Streptomyces sp. LBL TaxID=2940562 RepID=UPI002476A708|nr:helix-turn-helix transcriptional regulator [Streptomyces sp. LBL]MDH6622435.1 transcriptional regulator with XRE-family HTH domain [Streptomyces sp. LBL]
MPPESPRISRLQPYLDRPEPAPTLLKMLVGVQLAGFREDADLTQEQAARALRFSPAKLSRIESGKGRRPPAENDVRALLELYSTDDYEASMLLKLLQRAGEPGWWQRYDKRLMPEWFDRLVGLQEAAAAIRTFEIQYVPGLLQTADYTQAVVARGLPSAAASEVRRRVELRTRRAQLLERTDAPQLWAVLDESVLLRILGSREVMREQLRHLIERAQRPNVTVQIVPLDVTAASAPSIPITYLRFGGLDLPDVVYLEHIKSANFLEDRDETEEYRLALDRLANEALEPRDSIRLLEDTLKQRYGG